MSLPALQSLERMHEALLTLSQALASGDVQAVLAAERPLADAVRQLPRPDAVLAAGERVRMHQLVSEALHALDRCRQLGETAREVAAAGLMARQEYGRSGATVAPVRPATFHSRS